MARQTFPDDRFVLRPGSAGSVVRNAAGASAVVYADAAGSTLADIQTPDGTPVVGSTLTVDGSSRLPLFLGPDGVDTLYVSVDSGPLTAIYARTDDRIDALTALSTATKALVIDNPAAKTYPVWRAPKGYTITAVRGYRVGGTGATINAQINGNSVLGTDLSLTTASTWMSGVPTGGNALVAGDTLGLAVAAVTGAPTQLTVQVDLAVT